MLSTSTRPPKAPDTNRRPGRGTARDAVFGWLFALALSGGFAYLAVTHVLAALVVAAVVVLLGVALRVTR